MSLTSLLILAALSAAPTEVEPPSRAVLFHCDFEAKADTNYDDWPDGWVRRRAAGMPAYLKMGISPSHYLQPDGNHALRIELDGGAAQLNSPPILIDTNFDYVLEGQIQTDSLIHNKAFVVITFLNAHRKVVERLESPHLGQTSDWRRFRLGPLTPDDDAVQAIISLHLVPGQHSDLTGAALFDDLKLTRLPQVKLTTNQPTNLFHVGMPLEIEVAVTSPDEESPPVKLELADADGKLLSSQLQPIRGEFTWSPPIASPGLYRASASLHDGEPTEVTRQIMLAVIRPVATRRGGEFGWSVSQGRQPLDYKPLVELLGDVGIHWLKMPLWKESDDPEKVLKLGWLAERLQLRGAQLVGVLDDPPVSLREQFRDEGHVPVGAIFAEPHIWRPGLDSVLSRMSLYVRWWQLGDDHDSSLRGLPNLTKTLSEVQQHASQFGASTRVGLAWPWTSEPPPSKKPAWDFLALNANPALTAAELATYLEAKSSSQNSARWLLLEPLSRRNYELSDRVLDLVQRMMTAKIGGADAIFAVEPFHDDVGLMTADGTVSELLLPWRTTSQMLAGTEYLGSIKLPRGSRNHVFARGDEVILVVWNSQAVKERLFLGEQVTQVDVWGRETTPPTEHDDGWTTQELTVGPLPTFVTGGNLTVAKWRLAFAVNTPRLDPAVGRNQWLQYEFRNTASLAADGTVTPQLPESLRVANGKRRIRLAAEEMDDGAVEVQFRSDTTTGPQPIRFDFDITTDRSYRFSAYDSLYIGQGDVELDVTARLDDNGDLVVEQLLTNHRDTPINFSCVLFVPDRSREWKSVRELNRGQTTDTYILPNGTELIGKSLWLRAEEVGGDRILNAEVIVSP